MFLDIKQNSDMKFSSVTVNVSLWMVDVGTEHMDMDCLFDELSFVSLGDSWR